MVEPRVGVKECGDPKTKYGKYIIYQTQPNPHHPNTDPTRLNMFLDDRAVRGGFYWTGAIMDHADPPGIGFHKPHYHDFAEYIGMFGTDPKNRFDLGGEVEFWLDGEKHIITKSCVIYIPVGLPHCPYIYRRVDRPIFRFSCSPAQVLYEHISHDPKFKDFLDYENTGIPEVLD
jgi:hypothetical protein